MDQEQQPASPGRDPRHRLEREHGGEVHGGEVEEIEDDGAASVGDAIDLALQEDDGVAIERADQGEPVHPIAAVADHGEPHTIRLNGEAFHLIREEARRTNTKMVDVAMSLLSSYRLLPGREESSPSQEFARPADQEDR